MYSRDQLLPLASGLLLFLSDRLIDIADAVYKQHPLTTSVKKKKKTDGKVSLNAEIKK